METKQPRRNPLLSRAIETRARTRRLRPAAIMVVVLCSSSTGACSSSTENGAIDGGSDASGSLGVGLASGSSGSNPGYDGGQSSSSASSGAASASGTSADPSSGSGAGASAGKKFVGNISTNGAIRADFATYWTEFTPENEGKWGSVEPTPGTFNWAPLDAEYQYAQSHQIAFKHHNFVWGRQQPNWVGALSAAEATTAVQTWMTNVCTRYPKVKLIDVVNEPPPHTTPAYMNLIGGAGSSGYDWIVNAFKWARDACPNAILILNDYNNIEYQADHDHFVSIVKALKLAGTPVDAVGAQAHSAFSLPTSTVQRLLDSLASETGLPVYITEYDINIADDNQQAQVMMSQFPMFWSDPNVSGITLWGYIEGATWEVNTGLMSNSGTMRPAMSWLVNFLMTH